MRIITILLLGLFIINTGCAKKDHKQADITIQLDQSLFSESGSKLAKANTSLSSDGPNWGLEDPTQLSQIGCWAVVVAGPDEEFKKSQCTSSAGTTLKFGPRAGFFQINKSGQVSVPKGKDRVFYLAGLASDSGLCDIGFDKNPEVNFANYSAPFILGKSGLQNIENDGQEVRIQLQSVFSDENRIAKCDFFDDNPSNPNQLTLSFNHYTSKRSLWLENNIIPRTVDIVTNGSLVECSRDGGVTFRDTECLQNGTKYVWDVVDYNNPQYVRVSDSNGNSLTKSFTPSAENSGVTFLSCTDNFSGTGTLSDASFSGITSTASTDDSVLCFDDGVVLSEGTSPNDGPITITADRVILIAGQGHQAKISNSLGTRSVIKFFGSNDSKIIGIDIDSGASGANAGVLVQGSEGILVKDVEISNSTANGSGVYVYQSGSTTAIDMVNSKVEMSGSGIAVKTFGPATLNIMYSEMVSNNVTLNTVTGATSNVYSSTIENNGADTTKKVVNGYNGADILINDSTIIDGSGGGFVLNGNTSATVNVEVNNNTFIRKASGSVGTYPLFYGTNNGGTENLLSTYDGNSFCSEDSASYDFSPVIGTFLESSFTLDDQENGGVVSACP